MYDSQKFIDDEGTIERLYYDVFNVQEHSTVWKMEKFKETLYKKNDHKSNLFRTPTDLQYSFRVREVDRSLYDNKGKTFISVPHIQITLQVLGYTITDSNMIWLELSVHSNNSQANVYSKKELFDLSKVSRDEVFVDMYIRKCEIMSKNYVVDGAFTLKSLVKEIVAYD